LALIQFSLPAAKTLADELLAEPTRTCQTQVEIPSIKDRISLKNVSFQYTGTPNIKTIDNVSLTIEAGSHVGMVGSTGSGKTTMLDIISGLLEPTEGSIDLDGVTLCREHIQSWQSQIGYVSQHEFLLDASLRANIAFGAQDEEVDEKALLEAAQIAQLWESVILKLPGKFKTRVGENGTSFSGGERQRIGIARALYRKSNVLIFDESTSALDSITEKKFFDAMKQTHTNKTIIKVAHRLEAIRNCDKIFVFSEGCLVAEGSYPSLLRQNNQFIKHLGD
jgi:ABC-type bacteriocin/lantibiotic exporter with double-glycine peptidase domain